eukprot:6175295-Pleurochrysis_carterae.AAC.2
MLYTDSFLILTMYTELTLTEYIQNDHAASPGTGRYNAIPDARYPRPEGSSRSIIIRLRATRSGHDSDLITHAGPYSLTYCNKNTRQELSSLEFLATLVGLRLLGFAEVRPLYVRGLER